MRQLLQHLSDGRTVLLDVPAPGPRCGAVLVRTTRSLVSAGTERMLVSFGKAGWLGKARQQPEKVRAVVAKIRSEGLFSTIRAVQAKLAQPIPLGYCQVGKVVAVGRLTEDRGQRTEDPPLLGLGTASRGQTTDRSAYFNVGDRVVSNGPHAEIVSVSERHCTRIPDDVSDETATFTPLAAIALEGIDLLGVSAGDKVVVTGLGLIGQLAVRILRARGCEVLGFDPSEARRALAVRHGAVPGAGDPVAVAMTWSGGKGVAAVLITASTPAHEVVNQAARSCRYRGKVVLVGVVGLQLNRADFYANEVTFQVSCSYGRRDHAGPGSVRANFNSVLELMAVGQLPVDDLITHRYPLADVGQAYAALGDSAALGIVLSYDGGSDVRRQRTEDGQQEAEGGERTKEDVLSRTVELMDKSQEQGAMPRVALVGAGNFATRTLLPALRSAAVPSRLATVASNQGASAYLTAKQFGAHVATTDVVKVLAHPEIEAILLTTRHDAHSGQVLAAMRAGKHVWVEKPLCLNLNELSEIESVIKSAAIRPPILMVGFNRRFSPMARAVRNLMAQNRGPWRMVATINAGRLPQDHWTLDPVQGGGRIVGEGCHWVDLFRYLAGQSIRLVRCTRRDTDGQDGGCFELEFGDGSVGVLDYRTDLPPQMPKELIEVHGPAGQAVIRNWARLKATGLGRPRIAGLLHRSHTKGHPEALTAFLHAVQGGPAPIPLDEILEVSRWCIAMQSMRVKEVITEGK